MSLTLQDTLTILGSMVALTGLMCYRMDKLESNINKRLDKVDTNLATVASELNQRIGKVDTRLTNIIKKLDDLVR